MPHITANDISIYYEQKGVGDRVLYISGTGGDLRASPNVLAGPLARELAVLAYDQRGLGQTDKPDAAYTMEDYADDAAALMEAFGWADAHVVGVSFGGMVALNLALRHPERVNKLVLCCTSPGGSSPSFPFHELPVEQSVVERTQQLLGINDTRLDAEWQAAHPLEVEKILKDTESRAIAEHQTPSFRAGAQRQLMARAGHDVEARLGSIHHETLLCAGRYDGIAPAQNQEQMQAALPNARLEWFEGGHLFLLQDRSAWQRIIDFLKG